MTRVWSLRVTALAVGCCGALAVGGCATGTPVQHDAALPQQDAEVPADAGAQADGARDGTTPADGPLDGPAQQDAAHDTAVQQDAQTDVLVQTDRQSDAGECWDDVDCLPDAGVIVDGGRYCYRDKAKCYVPGTCQDNTECKTGQECRLILGTCSCPSLGFTCRPHEVCILFPGFGNFCSGE